MIPYSLPSTLSKQCGNNAFAWVERTNKYGSSPSLSIPSLIEWTIEDVHVGESIVFEEMESGILKSCVGLKNFVCIRKIRIDKNGETGVRGEGTAWAVMKAEKPRSEANTEWVPLREALEIPLGYWLPLETFGTFSHKSTESVSERDSPSENDKKWKPQELVIFDNHNHALYFWIDAVRKWIIEPGFTLIHIDEHSDLWANPNKLDLSKALLDKEYAWEFANLSCNVGNYIIPAIDSGLIGQMIRIENESEIDTYMELRTPRNTVLNLDLDIFAPELDFIPEAKKLHIIRNLIQQVDYVTIATSPFFIDQWIALQKLRNIMKV
jgi:hypothetical protein